MELADITNTLKNDGLVVMRTDTIYGIVALAASQKAVEKIYAAKNRPTNKQCILLISDANSVPANNEAIKFYTAANEQPTSVIVPVSDEPSWITRGGRDVAYRVIKDGLLKEVIDTVGPLVAPSANPEGQPPAHNIKEAEKYFGDKVDLYVDGGEVPAETAPSSLIRINRDGSVDKLR